MGKPRADKNESDGAKTGSSRAKNTAEKKCVAFSGFSIMLYGFLKGFTYSKMANWWLLIDCDTFWMIIWNDQKCDQIWTLGPRMYHENTSKIQENMGSSLNILSFHIWESASLICWKVRVPNLFICMFCNVELLKFEKCEIS